MMLPPAFASLGPLLKLLKALGVDPLKILNQAVVVSRMEKATPKIAAAMEKDGITLGNLAEGGLTGEEERLIIRDVSFRLWRKVFTFKGGGVAADYVRDRQSPKIVAEVSPQADATTSPLALVEKVREATIRLTF